jgi:hypothetical protein
MAAHSRVSALGYHAIDSGYLGAVGHFVSGQLSGSSMTFIGASNGTGLCGLTVAGDAMVSLDAGRVCATCLDLIQATTPLG